MGCIDTCKLLLMCCSATSVCHPIWVPALHCAAPVPFSPTGTGFHRLQAAAQALEGAAGGGGQEGGGALQVRVAKTRVLRLLGTDLHHLSRPVCSWGKPCAVGSGRVECCAALQLLCRLLSCECRSEGTSAHAGFATPLSCQHQISRGCCPAWLTCCSSSLPVRCSGMMKALGGGSKKAASAAAGAAAPAAAENAAANGEAAAAPAASDDAAMDS